MKNEKSWFWYRNHEYDQKAKPIKVGDAAAVDATLPKPKRVTSVSTRLYWGKAANRLGVMFGLDGGECFIYFYFMLPWLFGVSFTLNCDWTWFKSRWPKLIETSGSKEWGFGGDRHYLALYWYAYSDRLWSSDKRTGFHFIADWVDLIKGQCTGVKWEPAKLVLARDVEFPILYKSELYPDVPQTVTGRVEVREKRGKWTYPRWWPKYHTRYEISCDRTFVFPGKGENSWDCVDNVVTYQWHEDSQHAGFSTGSAKSAEEALQVFCEDIKKSQVRR